MRKFCALAFTAVVALGLYADVVSPVGNHMEDIYAEFEIAPDSTRTKVWWFHGETTTTKDGITADLEAFRDAGVGGVVYYDQVHGDAKDAFPVFSDEWWDALIYAASEAKRLGLTFEINLSNGFVSGGPWITEDMSMKRLCSSELVLSSGEVLDSVFPAPSDRKYWDVKLLAFPVPSDVNWEDKILVSEPVKSDTSLILVYDFGTPFTARSFTYSEHNPSKNPNAAMNYPGFPSDTFYGDGYVELPPIGELEVSDDGENYTTVCTLPTIYNYHNKIKTVSFPAATGRYFRLNFHNWNRVDGKAKRTLTVRSASLSGKPMVYGFEGKSGVNSEYIGKDYTPDYGMNEVIGSGEIRDISHLLGENGRLRWQAPDDGRSWVVMRVAQTSTRGHTKHGRPGQMGLESDKLSAVASKLQWDNFAKVIIDTLEKRGMKPWGVVMDSHEMGSQNWTHGYDKEFKYLRGYDITRYLPAVLGYVVDSKGKSDSVLSDHRKALAYLVDHRYFAALDTLAMESGVNFTPQAMGNYQGMINDNISVKGIVRRPQGEFWGKHPHGVYDTKEAASAAHIYGKQVASAEAYTDAKYSQSLAYLKSTADCEYAFQLNEFVVCASAYQPWLDKMPGNTANGREYCLNRNNTMWDLSRGFWDYQSRCAFMLRQGRPVVDICIYLGSEVPVKILSHRLPVVPEGYEWDACTDDALLRLMSAKKGKLVTESGMEYGILVIERMAKLTAEAENKVRELAESGVPVYDARVRGDYGLKEFADSIGLRPDVKFESAAKPDDRVLFAHRVVEDNDIYFVVNHSASQWSYPVVLRGSSGKVPEFWNPLDGKRNTLSYTRSSDGDLELPLTLAPCESGFIVLDDNRTESVELPERSYGNVEEVYPVRGVWKVDFQLPGGTRTLLTELKSWTEFEDEEVKYHSGTAVYHNRFDTPADIALGKRVYIRIDGLESVSRIEVNGKDAGYMWCSPYELEITDLLDRKSDNTLSIEVANQLTNRMIGDLSLPEDKRVTYATTPIVKEGDNLLPAGITGCVSVVVR